MADSTDLGCSICGLCRDVCPNEAIVPDDSQPRIDADRCDGCPDAAPFPPGVISCANLQPPPPPRLPTLVGRPPQRDVAPLIDLPPDLSVASALVVWEGCNLLAQQDDLPWERQDGRWTYRKAVKHGRGELQFWLQGDRGERPGVRHFDVRSACLHVLYAACATTLAQPWNESFRISDRQISGYLGLDRRRDLNRQEKLALLERLVLQSSQLRVAAHWLSQGQIPAFDFPESALWQILELDYHWQDDSQRVATGFTLQVRPGRWSEHFLNREGSRDRTAFYQTTGLNPDWLETAARNWQRHPGVLRSMLWLLFKFRMGSQRPLRVSTLMQVAYGNAKLDKAERHRDTRKRCIRTFERDLEVLAEAGLVPQFDPDSYPVEMQPLWARLQAVPDDSDAASDFWAADAKRERSLTDFAPRGKWKILQEHARLLGFDLGDR